MSAESVVAAEEGPSIGPWSPVRAAALSFLWPGLGQLVGGRQRAAALFAFPVLVVAVVVLAWLAGGLEVAALSLFRPAVAITVLVASILVAAWRIAAIADAIRPVPLRRLRGRPAAAVAALLALVVVPHAVVALYAWSFWTTGSRIFVPDDEGPVVVLPTRSPAATSSGGSSSPLPVPTQDPGAPRITVLLTGIDSGPNRNHSLTDTLLVASLDPDTRRLVMVSFPRDITNFELWDGRTFRAKINSLQTYADNHPAEFPAGGRASLMAALSHLVGIPIDYYAAVDLQGFRRLIDAVGGVTVNVERRINDPLYDWLDGQRGFRLEAGVHTLDGRTALAYVRSRRGAGDNDFTRAARQQQLLVALRGKLTDPSMIARLPEMLDIAADTVTTNFPVDQAPDMLSLLRDVDDGSIDRYVLGPPYAFHPPTNTTGGIYTLRLDMDRVAALSVELFGSDSRYATLSGDAGSDGP